VALLSHRPAGPGSRSQPTASFSRLHWRTPRRSHKSPERRPGCHCEGGPSGLGRDDVSSGGFPSNLWRLWDDWYIMLHLSRRPTPPPTVLPNPFAQFPWYPDPRGIPWLSDPAAMRPSPHLARLTFRRRPHPCHRPRKRRWTGGWWLVEPPTPHPKMRTPGGLHRCDALLLPVRLTPCSR